jgi:hypothetical protein
VIALAPILIAEEAVGFRAYVAPIATDKTAYASVAVAKTS